MFNNKFFYLGQREFTTLHIPNCREQQRIQNWYFSYWFSKIILLRNCYWINNEFFIRQWRNFLFIVLQPLCILRHHIFAPCFRHSIILMLLRDILSSSYKNLIWIYSSTRLLNFRLIKKSTFEKRSLSVIVFLNMIVSAFIFSFI